jgi:ketosteroid isomerase-like protein
MKRSNEPSSRRSLMKPEVEVQAAENRFFGALLRSDWETLEQVLGPDFVLIDVMSGSEVRRSTLLAIVASQQLTFESVERMDARLRLYPGVAIVTGQTLMRGSYGEQPFNAHSRYTHVYLRAHDGWRLVTAQGTPVASHAQVYRKNSRETAGQKIGTLSHWSNRSFLAESGS